MDFSPALLRGVPYGTVVGTMTTPQGMKLSARVTAVFRREGDDWKIVQSHVSMGRRLTP